MSKFPEPPSVAELTATPPEVCTLPAGTLLWRVYFRAGGHPSPWHHLRHFGPTTARFDHHLPPPHVGDRGVLYAAKEGATCLAEVFQATRLIDRQAKAPWLVGFELTAETPLLDLTGVWPTRAGASMALSTGPRPRAQRWAQAIYTAYPHLAGLYYPSSMNANRPAVALTERARGAISPPPVFHRALADPVLHEPLRQVAAQLGYLLA